MKAVGIIVEYNPFHNGHYYHVQETRKVTGADVVIAVMSGNFLQRGEPALVSKWTRTKMALEGGVDLVIELPYAFATQKAEIFAYGAAFLLDALQVDCLCFGSESGDINAFKHTVKMVKAKKKEIDDYIQNAKKQGKSYPRLASEAYQSLQLSNNVVDLSQPNNILGYHYLEALDRLQSHINPFTIKRKKANYHDHEFADNRFASATSIRKALIANGSYLKEIQDVVPKTTYNHLQNYYQDFEMYHFWEDYFPFLKYRLLSTTAAELRQIYEIEEGLEHRLIHLISESATFHEFMTKLKTKRYTWTRLQRICVHILTNTTKEQMKAVAIHPTYIRLLGTNLIGQAYLNKIKKNISLPIVSRLASFSNEQIALDIRAANIYASCLREKQRSKMIRNEFAQPPIRYDQINSRFL
ncbi:nucleotidyltransferase [Calidifontibacillus erzurumensis]|uniref:tRNA(Met) cytidine acetate ligase n=1 Tax=Calidifontibacillus erzurumensis TaxID=2741433 RepID=A0A8J8GBS5_9BACI|nr:nucleotidyltransferase [Calidifontibacillus erzurumensis]NSL50762.1 nucleotidyltransferase [Calidifontibacillus erzurumensis]